MANFYTNVFVHNNELYERGYENNKPFFKKQSNFQPKIYTCSANCNTKIKCLTAPELSLREHIFKNIREMKNFCWDNENTIYGNLDVVAQFITHKYGQQEVEYDTKLVKKMFFDIETTAENGFPDTFLCNETITLITCGYEKNKTVTFSCYGQYTGNATNVDYRYYDNETDMLKEFIVWFENEKPDVFSGYYSDSFDIPYLFRRIEKLLSRKWLNRLSPVGAIQESKQYAFSETIIDENGNEIEKEKIIYKIKGIQTVDYLDIYKKFHSGEVDSYKLDNIAEMEIGWRKIENPTETFKEFYNGSAEFTKIPEKFKDLECVQLSYERYLAKQKYGIDSNEYVILDAKTKQSFWNLFVEYNVRDVELLIELENKLGYLNLLMIIAYMMFSNYEDILATITQWHNRLYNELYKIGLVWENKKERTRKQSFEGGYVKEVQLGLHKWVVSFDYTSLYPTLMRALGISPETFRGVIDVNINDLLEQKTDLSFLKEKNYSLGANGALYDNNIDGFLPKIITTIFNQRKKENNLKKQYSREIEELIKTLPQGIDIEEYNLEELQTMLDKM